MLCTIGLNIYPLASTAPHGWGFFYHSKKTLISLRKKTALFASQKSFLLHRRRNPHIILRPKIDTDHFLCDHEYPRFMEAIELNILSPLQEEWVAPLLSNPSKATHLIFRILGPYFQQQYSSQPILHSAPKTFIHGNPHIDNYVRTFHGAGMVDFDRSRIGPYCWDLIRILSSLQICGKKKLKQLPPSVWKYVYKGYKNGFLHTEILYTEPSFLHQLRPKEGQLSTQKYLLSKKKWAKKLHSHSVSIDDPTIRIFLQLFLQSRKEEKLLKYFHLHTAARCDGSLGKEHILLLLKPNKNKQSRDSILLDIKETYQEEDTELFHNPADHHGLRMIRASNLYAPNIEQRLGYFTHDQIQYWGREVPSFNAKIKFLLKKQEQEELGYSVASQLGRGHRIALESKPKKLLKHLKTHKDVILLLAQQMTADVLSIQEDLRKKYQ